MSTLTKKSPVKKATTETRTKGKLSGISKLKKLNNYITQKSADFGNSNGVNKQKAREVMLKHMTNLHGVILTLPFKFATFEKMILNVCKKVSFLAYERDDEVAWELSKTIGNDRLPISLMRGSIIEGILNAKRDTFSNLILDYCGVLDTFANEIEYAVKNYIVEKDGIIAITLSKIGLQNDKGIIGDIFRATPKEMFDSNIGETELGVKLFLNRIMPLGDYEVKEVFNYNDTKENGKKGMAMILVVIKRLR